MNWKTCFENFFSPLKKIYAYKCDIFYDILVYPGKKWLGESRTNHAYYCGISEHGADGPDFRTAVAAAAR